MRTLRIFAVLALVCAVGAAPAAAAGPGLEVTEATLDNGLRVLLLEDHRSPIVSVQMWYRVARATSVWAPPGSPTFSST